ncbi:MAG: hypothetical protein HZB98_01425 [Bacteroidia bacterium]|nr:hypothetical protein [Bacteroidia bacterium]
MHIKQIINAFLIIMFITAVSVSCVSNNEYDLYGIPDCDTTNVTWDSKISAIMQANCVVCHGEDVSYNGVRHDSYESEMIVVNDGRLRGVVNHLDGYVKMPKDPGKLPACELELINTWLDNGAPEN